MMKAVILAGGRGVRLGEISERIPKPMVEIGGKPLLEHQVSLLERYGIKHVIFITGHLSSVIEEYFADGRKRGVKISYYKEEKPLGTTGGLKEIEHLLTEDFIVFYGDVMLDMNLAKLISFHRKKKSAATLVLHPNDHPYDSDLVEIDPDSRIVAFHPKPRDDKKYYRNLVNAGIYVLSPGILDHVKKGVKADFGKDLFPKIVINEPLYGYNTAEYLKDMGTPDRLKNVEEDYLTGKIRRLNCENPRPAVFLDRDGVINEEVGLLHKAEEFRLLPGVADAVKKINQSEYLAIVVTNQPVVARNLCSIPQLEAIHNKMETLLGEQHAKLDAIYFCPHHPDKGYPEENKDYKMDCDCRKPGIGMIKKAEKEFNIDLSASFIIGDSSRDMLCGKKAGLTTIAVGCGYAGKDHAAKPDRACRDLPDAVDYIMGCSEKKK